MRSQIFRRFMALAGGSITGQFAMIAVLPIITRLYEPADFGMLGAFTAIVMLVLPVACLRFDIAIPIPADQDDARTLAVLGALASAVISVLVMGALLVFRSDLPPEYASVFQRFGWLIPLTIWAGSLFSLAQFWAIRQNMFRTLAFSHVSRGTLGATTQVGLGLGGVGSIGLLLGQAIYMGLGVFILLRSFLRQELAGLRRLRPYALVQAARKYWRFPVFSTPEALLDSAGMQLPLLLIASFSGVETAGLLYLAQRVTRIPVGLVGSNLSRVFIGEAPKQLAKGTLFGFTVRIWGMLLLAGLPAVLLVTVSMPYLSTALFGPKGGDAGHIVFLLLPATLFQFCIMPVSSALHVLSKQAVALTLQAGGLILQVGSILLAFSTELIDPLTALAAGAALYYVVYTMTVLLVTRASR